MDNSIEYSRHLAITRDETLRPSVLYQQILKISIDGNMYCVLMGENIQEGITGFGDTMLKALNDFDTNMGKELKITGN